MEITNGRIELIQGDITKISVDCIVNAANSSLLGGGGVDGAIHRAGGPAILEECKQIVARWGECQAGEAVITTAGNLPAKHVIHTVGPIWTGGQNDEEQKLSNCYFFSLELAVKHNCQSIAFPNISTGVYRFPKEQASRIAIETVRDFLSKAETMKKVIFVCFDDENLRLYKQHLSI